MNSHAATATMPSAAKWGRLAPPVDAEETRIRMRAQSILSGGDIGACPALTLDQARDVLAWHKPMADVFRLNGACA